jgi:hypothetical protein
VGPRRSSRRAHSARGAGLLALEQARAGLEPAVDPVEDVGRLGDHLAAVGDQHGDGLAAPGAPRLDAVDDLHVALLAVGQLRAVERPAGLLAVMADRDRDQTQHNGGSMALW